MRGVMGVLCRGQPAQMTACLASFLESLVLDLECSLRLGGVGQECCFQMVRYMDLDTSELGVSPTRAK